MVNKPLIRPYFWGVVARIPMTLAAFVEGGEVMRIFIPRPRPVFGDLCDLTG